MKSVGVSPGAARRARAPRGRLLRPRDTRDAPLGTIGRSVNHPRGDQGRQPDHDPEGAARNLRAGSDPVGVRSALRRHRRRRANARGPGRHRANVCARTPRPSRGRRIRRVLRRLTASCSSPGASRRRGGRLSLLRRFDERSATVLWFGSAPAEALFHADCGGRTSRADDVWTRTRTTVPDLCRGRRPGRDGSHVVALRSERRGR